MNWLKGHSKIVVAMVASICVFAQKLGLPLTERDIDHLTQLALAYIGGQSLVEAAFNHGQPPPQKLTTKLPPAA